MSNDIRNTFRFLRREPLLTAVILGTLGIGIGINTAIFSVLDAVVVRPLPYPEAGQLVAVWQQDRKDKSPFVVSAANFFDWQKQESVFESLAAVQQFQKREYNLALAVAPDNVKGVCVSPDLFKVLRVNPAIGRGFTADDAETNRAPVVILSHELWVGRFGSDPQIVGRDLRVNGEKVTIIGVMPAGFEIPLIEAQMYMPLKLTSAERQERRIANFLILGRLQRGVRVETAMTKLDPVAFALERAYPESNKNVGILITPLKDQVVGPLRPVLWAIFGAAGCVLLLACLNLANILGVRGIRRQREFAIRTSLGASRRRLLRQVLTEGLVISAAGGVIGLFTGMWAVRIFLALFNNSVYFSLPRRAEIGLDLRVLAFTVLACVLTAMLFSLAPAWTALTAKLQSTGYPNDGRWGNRLRGALVVCEVASCLALVITAALLVRSYSRLQSEDRGFSTADVLTANITLPEARYPSTGPSWNAPFGLLPSFEMNLPEGFLRERLRLAFAKATGAFDEFDLLSIVGRSQIGRIRYTGEKEQLHEEVPFQSVDEILERRRGGDLFRHLIEKFASVSGISGVQPKILVRDQKTFAEMEHSRSRLSQSYRGATHIVKLWQPNDYPQLAANEYFCLTAARKCGLDVPPLRLADDGMALVIDRFDLRMDGTYRGFEDFCALNARRTDEKYRGSYETSAMKRFAQFANSTHVHEDLGKLFTLIALTCALRNGDAHLKNFGVVYDDVQSEARLAPVYDLVTTSVYLAKDSLALTLNGSTRWPTAKELRKLGETRAGGAPAAIRQILERIDEAIQATSREVRSYIKQHREFAGIGKRMLQEWQTGSRTSLRD